MVIVKTGDIDVVVGIVLVAVIPVRAVRVCPHDLIIICAGDCVPCDPAGCELGVVPFYETGVTGFRQRSLCICDGKGTDEKDCDE